MPVSAVSAEMFCYPYERNYEAGIDVPFISPVPGLY
jgi:hypothetical protein